MTAAWMQHETKQATRFQGGHLRNGRLAISYSHMMTMLELCYNGDHLSGEDICLLHSADLAPFA